MLGEKEINNIREELKNCKNPLFFFHDDPDGLCSFLLLYRYIKEGSGVVVKAKPTLDKRFISKVHEYSPDKVFIVDVPIVDQEFIDEAKTKVVWIDHHEPLERDNVLYFNPRIKNKSDGIPATRICYEVTKQDLWIAAVGCIGDWHIPDFFQEFKDRYALVDDANDVGKIYFTSKLGLLVRIFSYILKGNTNDANKCFKILTRIEDPNEILEQTTSRGKFIYKRYEQISEKYQELIMEALKHVTKDELVVYIYEENKMSFNSDLANELIYRFPDKIIIVGRERKDEIRLSIRSTKKLLPPILKKALVGLVGYGGGHEYACGANIKKEDFKRFIENIREQI